MFTLTWVIVFMLIALISGIIIGVFMVTPRSSSSSRRYSRYSE